MISFGDDEVIDIEHPKKYKNSLTLEKQSISENLPF